MRDLVTKVIQDYERSLSVIPRSKLNQYLERIKEDQEYQSHKEENVLIEINQKKHKDYLKKKKLKLLKNLII